jgi:rubrerythrin
MSKRSQGIIPEFKSLEEILEEAILHEQESHDYYLEAAERTRNADLKRFLQHLAEVELRHKTDLQEKLDMLRNEQALANDLLYSFGEPPV